MSPLPRTVGTRDRQRQGQQPPCRWPQRRQRRRTPCRRRAGTARGRCAAPYERCGPPLRRRPPLEGRDDVGNGREEGVLTEVPRKAVAVELGLDVVEHLGEDE